ncbi:hypothetical protein HRbin39_00362 [bacterium HR39]|nr:hypothetical protein HRbin39_00362 [bacterium HR39]
MGDLRPERRSARGSRRTLAERSDRRHTSPRERRPDLCTRQPRDGRPRTSEPEDRPRARGSSASPWTANARGPAAPPEEQGQRTHMGRRDRPTNEDGERVRLSPTHFVAHSPRNRAGPPSVLTRFERLRRILRGWSGRSRAPRAPAPLLHRPDDSTGMSTGGERRGRSRRGRPDRTTVRQDGGPAKTPGRPPGTFARIRRETGPVPAPCSRSANDCIVPSADGGRGVARSGVACAFPTVRTVAPECQRDVNAGTDRGASLGCGSVAECRVALLSKLHADATRSRAAVHAVRRHPTAREVPPRHDLGVPQALRRKVRTAEIRGGLPMIRNVPTAWRHAPVAASGCALPCTLRRSHAVAAPRTFHPPEARPLRAAPLRRSLAVRIRRAKPVDGSPHPTPNRAAIRRSVRMPSSTSTTRKPKAVPPRPPSARRITVQR